MSDLKTISYPEKITTIPYASFLQIERWEYQDALKKVAANQNDALGAVQNSNKAIQTILNGVKGGVENLYTARDNLDNNVFGDQAAFSTKDDENYFFKNDMRLDHLDVMLPGEDTYTNMKALRNDKEFKKKLNLQGLSATKCFLPMPNEFQYQYGADWNNKFKLGTLALLADNSFQSAATIIGGGLAFGTASTIINKINNIPEIKDTKKDKGRSNQISEVSGAIAQGAQFGVNPFKVNSDFSPKNIVGLAGLAPNENAIQMFQSMDMREFEFTFELASRKSSESTKIQSIIEWFKRGMHPTTKNGRGSAVLLQFPDVWRITPKFVPVKDEGEKLISQQPIQHPMMPKTKLCAMTGLQVNTTPMGSLATVFDGTIPLVQVTVRFKELTALTRMDMEGSAKINGNFKEGKNGEPGTVTMPSDQTRARFVKSGQMLDNYPKVSY